MGIRRFARAFRSGRPYLRIMEPENSDPIYRWQASSERFIPAIILIGVGAIFLLNNLHILPVRDVARYWPAILIAVGVVQLVDSSFAAGRTVGGVLVGVGGFMLARNLGYLDIPFHDLWPLILIGIGLLMLLDRTVLWRGAVHIGVTQRRQVRNWREAQVIPGLLNEHSVFGGGKRKVNTDNFKGGKVDAIFSGYEIDLRDAMMTADSATLEANAVFGGIEIRIPPTWSAVVQGVGVFGAFQDETSQPNASLIPNPKRFIVKGGAVFGAVEVKN